MWGLNMLRCGFSSDSAMMNVTPVQNIFIIEYMPKAPDAYVKVYLYGLMQCCCRAMEGADMEFALGLSGQEIVEAMLYWQQQGLLAIRSDDPLEVEYKNIAAAAPVGGGVRRYGELVKALQDVVGTRVLTPAELDKIYDWIEIFGFEEAAAVLLVKHCVEKNGAKVKIQYMDKTAKSWADAGILTAVEAEAHLAAQGELSSGAQSILKRWRRNRRATQDELELYRKWTEEWGMTGEEILAACPAMTAAEKPSFAYLNSILENARLTGTVKDYISAQDAIAELARQVFLRAGIKKTPTSAQKEQMEVWSRAWHMDPELILLAAEYAADSSTPFAEIRRLLTDWHEKGVRSVAAARREYESAKAQKQHRGTQAPHAMDYPQRKYTADDLKHIGIKLLDEEEEG